MRKLAVLNWAGHGNLGDELFNDAYRRLFPDWDITFFTNCEGAGLPLIDFDYVNKCDMFALGGGELINSGQLFIPSYWTSKIKAEIPKIILGCGVNVKDANDLKLNVIQELNNFSYIGLRDYASIKMLQRFSELRNRVGLFYDLAFSAFNPDSFNPVTPDVRKVVVIPTDRFSNSADRGILEHNFVKKSSKWLKASTFDKVTFIAFGKEDNDDYKTCVELAKLVPNTGEIIGNCYLNKQLMLETIAGSSVVFAYRLHGLILAKMFGKPCGFYPYHRKLTRMNDTLLGCDPDVIGVWQRECLNKILWGLSF